MKDDHGAVRDRGFIDQAARLALRGHGGAEPNPMVGCVLVDEAGAVVGWGYHRRCGEEHAERAALRRAGAAARGTTAYVTLQPCNGHGRTGPCTEALIDAGVRSVVYAVDDPHPLAAGGVERLRAAGLDVRRVPTPAARRVTEPFLHGVATGRPWVIAKWAQSIDGRIATASGESQWISGTRSRRLVHRERGRVDVILTGIGTVRADDPQLTARRVRRRRTARRAVVDPHLDIPLDSRLVAGAGETPVTVVATADAIMAHPDRTEALRRAGVEVVPFSGPADEAGAAADRDPAGDVRLDGFLGGLRTRHGAATVLVESGGGLLGALLRQSLVDEALVFVAPMFLGDEGVPGVGGLSIDRLDAVPRWSTVGVRRRGDDVLIHLRAKTERSGEDPDGASRRGGC